jgi:hypothetical protein
VFFNKSIITQPIFKILLPTLNQLENVYINCVTIARSAFFIDTSAFSSSIFCFGLNAIPIFARSNMHKSDLLSPIATVDSNAILNFCAIFSSEYLLQTEILQ